MIQNFSLLLHILIIIGGVIPEIAIKRARERARVRARPYGFSENQKTGTHAGTLTGTFDKGDDKTLTICIKSEL